jgi:hypothetical protein
MVKRLENQVLRARKPYLDKYLRKVNQTTSKKGKQVFKIISR